MTKWFSMTWQVCSGTGGNFEAEYYIAFRLYPATHSGQCHENGRFAPEWVATLLRNRWQVSAGTGGRFAPEYALNHPLYFRNRSGAS